MLTKKESRLLAKTKQLAVQKKDYKMINLLSKVKKSSDITKEMKEYSL